MFSFSWNVTTSTIVLVIVLAIGAVLIYISSKTVSPK